MSAFLLPNAGGGQEPNRVRHGRLVQYIQNICPLELRDPVTGYIPGTKIIYIFVNRVGTKFFLFNIIYFCTHSVCPSPDLTTKHQS